MFINTERLLEVPAALLWKAYAKAFSQNGRSPARTASVVNKPRPRDSVGLTDTGPIYVARSRSGGQSSVASRCRYLNGYFPVCCSVSRAVARLNSLLAAASFGYAVQSTSWTLQDSSNLARWKEPGICERGLFQIIHGLIIYFRGHEEPRQIGEF